MNDSSLDKQNWKCQSCPVGGYCTGLTSWKDVLPKYGWWRLHDITSENINRPPDCLNDKENQGNSQPSCAFEKCLYPHACHGKSNPAFSGILGVDINGTQKDTALIDRNESCDESNGYSNNCTDQHGEPARCRLCATCIGTGEKRYKRSGSGTTCKLCPKAADNRILLAVGFVIMVIGSAVMIKMAIASEKSEDELSDVVKKIILNFLQMVSLAGGLPLQWPNAVNVMFDSFSTLSSAGTTLMIPDCELTNMRTAEAFYMKQIVYTFAVPMIVFICLFIWAIISCCCSTRMKLSSDKIKDYTILSIVLMLFLCYPTLVKLTLSMFKCPIVGGQSYLMAE